MAEFCLDCWNKIYCKDYSKWDVKLSWGLDLCEGCGEWKRVVLEKRGYWDDRFVLIWLVLIILDGIIQLLLYPLRCYQRKRKRRPK
ncbi:MAG: hypothetical protein J6U87_05900 [Clostridia bacterium]|nr:hypothetical protein [Clostridia bacterium]